VIVVLVRHHNRGDGIGRNGETFQPRHRIVYRKAAVYEQISAIGFDQQAVAFATATQTCKAHVEDRARVTSADL